MDQTKQTNQTNQTDQIKQIKQIKQRINSARQNRERWKGYIDECYKYFIPEKNLNSKFQKIDLYDSTGPDAINDYASRMETQLVPSGRHWMKLEAGSDIPDDKVDEVNRALEEITKTLFDHINSSNFSSQIAECFLDLGISTGCLIVEKGDGIQSGLRFRSVPLQELLIEKSEKGIIETVFREITVPFNDLMDIFPDVLEELKKEPDYQELKDKNKEIDLIEGVIKETGSGSKDTKPSKSSRSSRPSKGFRNIVLYKDKLLRDQTLESSPWIVFRESTTSGETYGRGRAMRCLADAKTANKVMEYYIDTCELLANPIYTAVDDGIINPGTIKVRPKTIIPVGASDSINPLPQSGRPELNIDLLQRLQDNIRRTLLSKPFGMIDETPVRTATEMNIRNADLAQTTGAASGRIQVELLERVIARCVFILKEQGIITPFKINGKEVKIKYTSPNAKMQDELELQTIMRFIGAIQALPPEVIQTSVKMDKIPKEIADLLGVNSNIIMTDAEKAEKEQQIQMMMQAQAQSQAQ